MTDDASTSETWLSLGDLEALAQEHGGSLYAAPVVRKLTGQQDLEEARDALQASLRQWGLEWRYPRPEGAPS